MSPGRKLHIAERRLRQSRAPPHRQTDPKSGGFWECGHEDGTLAYTPDPKLEIGAIQEIRSRELSEHVDVWGSSAARCLPRPAHHLSGMQMSVGNPAPAGFRFHRRGKRAFNAGQE
jgi:hypothetical protein